MTIGWPSWLDSGSQTMRPTMSIVLPGANGIIALTGRAGHACAKAMSGRAGAAKRAAERRRNRRRLVTIVVPGGVLPKLLRRDRHLMHLHAERHGGVIAEQHQHFGDSVAAQRLLDFGKI